jgi:membrane dipeptidase
MKHLFPLLMLLFCVHPFCGVSAEQDERLIKKANEILREVPLIDGHNDLPWQIREKFKNHLQQVDLMNTTKYDPPFHTDIPRLKKGMVGGQFWSVYVPVELKEADAVQAVFEQIDIVDRFVKKHPDAFEMAYKAEDIQRIHKNGKIASLIGVEGGHCINNSLAVLRRLFHAGARYMTLTHWSGTDWADSATTDPMHQGITAFGQRVVKEMNRLGMLVDLSHVSEETMNDVLDIARAPVIFSHSSARSISAHPRNVPDEVLKRLPKNGGVVMVNYATAFVSEKARLFYIGEKAEEERIKQLYIGNPEQIKIRTEEWKTTNPAPEVTLQELVDHIDHIRNIAGIDHIGIGADLDGITATPVGLGDVSTYPALIAELLRRNYTREEVKKVAGLNVLRVMRRAEQVAAAMQKETSSDDSRIEEVDPARATP